MRSLRFAVAVIVARVLIPMNTVTYNNIVSYKIGYYGTSYELHFSDGRIVNVPVAFTIIEEKK